MKVKEYNTGKFLYINPKYIVCTYHRLHNTYAIISRDNTQPILISNKEHKRILKILK